MNGRRWLGYWFVAVLMVAAACGQETQAVRKVGTVKAISGSTLTLKPDSGSEVNVTLQDSTRILRLAPGQTDLKSATPMQASDVQVGDRMLVRGAAGTAADSVVASTIVVMKQGDVAQKQQQDLQQWQRNGTGGIVSAIDAASGTITLKITPSSSAVVKTTKDTQYLRYAPDSVKFSDAQKGSFDQIKVGDQLRARGSRSADGKEVTAAEVVSGTFRNIAGTITSIDAATSSVTIKDILARKSVTVKLTPDSQMRKLPQPLAQRIAFFLKSPEAAQSMAAAGGAGNTGAAGAAGSPGAGGRPGGGGTPDFGQMVNRLPAVTLADLQKDEAVMIVSTSGNSGSPVTAITLLSGVEPILTASPNASGAAALLSGWNLSAPGGGDAGPQ